MRTNTEADTVRAHSPEIKANKAIETACSPFQQSVWGKALR